jgi:hypothetical protein
MANAAWQKTAAPGGETRPNTPMERRNSGVIQVYH